MSEHKTINHSVKGKRRLVEEVRTLRSRLAELERGKGKPREAEEALWEKDRLNERLLDTLPHPAMLIRKDRTVLAANRIAREVGAKVDGYCWRDFGQSDFIPDEDKKYINDHKKVPPGGTHCTFCLADEALKKQQPTDNPEIHAWGKTWDTHWIPLDKDVYLHYAIDITERKDAEEKIVRAKEEWERTFMAVPDLIAIIDKQRRIVRVNKAMAERMGVALDEAARMICYECVHGTKEPPKFCPHTKLLADSQEHTEEIYEEHLGGHFVVSVSPLRDDDGSLMGCVHVARDITERKQGEEALRRQREDQEIILDSVPAAICGLLPKSWSSFSESMIDKFGVLFNPKKGDCTHEKAFQWITDRGKVTTGRCAYWSGKGYPGSL